eukprot:GHVN01001846.1.p1 GENE.GHVN01001846.1~~GHVN01001846.1.p1  ORF type:complete len:949 (-),score=77.37 GHVN01001846.1:5559-8405(-)
MATEGPSGGQKGRKHCVSGLSARKRREPRRSVTDIQKNRLTNYIQGAAKPEGESGISTQATTATPENNLNFSDVSSDSAEIVVESVLSDEEALYDPTTCATRLSTPDILKTPTRKYAKRARQEVEATSPESSPGRQSKRHNPYTGDPNSSAISLLCPSSCVNPKRSTPTIKSEDRWNFGTFSCVVSVPPDSHEPGQLQDRPRVLTQWAVITSPKREAKASPEELIKSPPDQQTEPGKKVRLPSPFRIAARRSLGGTEEVSGSSLKQNEAAQIVEKKEKAKKPSVEYLGCSVSSKSMQSNTLFQFGLGQSQTKTSNDGTNEKHGLLGAVVRASSCTRPGFTGSMFNEVRPSISDQKKLSLLQRLNSEFFSTLHLLPEPDQDGLGGFESPQPSKHTTLRSGTLNGPVALVGCFDLFTHEELKRWLRCEHGVAVGDFKVLSRNRTACLVAGHRCSEGGDIRQSEQYKRAQNNDIEIIVESEMLKRLQADLELIEKPYEPRSDLDLASAGLTGAVRTNRSTTHRPVSLHEIVGHREQIVDLHRYLETHNIGPECDHDGPQRSSRRSKIPKSQANKSPRNKPLGNLAILCGPPDCGIQVTAELCSYGTGYAVTVRRGEAAEHFWRGQRESKVSSGRTCPPRRVVILTEMDLPSINELKEMSLRSISVILLVVESDLRLEDRLQCLRNEGVTLIRFFRPPPTAVRRRLKGICNHLSLVVEPVVLSNLMDRNDMNIPRCLRELGLMYTTSKTWCQVEFEHWMSNNPVLPTTAIRCCFSPDPVKDLTSLSMTISDRLEWAEYNASSDEPSSVNDELQEGFLSAKWPVGHSLDETSCKQFGFSTMTLSGGIMERAAKCCDMIALTDVIRNQVGGNPSDAEGAGPKESDLVTNFNAVYIASMMQGASFHSTSRKLRRRLPTKMGSTCYSKYTLKCAKDRQASIAANQKAKHCVVDQVN